MHESTTYTINDWLTFLKISRTTFWRKLKNGHIPKADKNLGTEKHPCWRWLQTTVDGYLSNSSTNL